MLDTKIPLYAIMILLSLLANVIVVLFLSKKSKFTKNKLIVALVYENIGIVCGAKLLAYIQNYRLYGKFDFFSVGLSSYGAVIGAMIGLIIFSIQFKKLTEEELFIFTPPIPLMYAIGKIGCFLVGCCYGIEYSGIGNVVYNYSPTAPEHIHLFPIQIVETIVFTGIFIYMIIKYREKQFNLKTIGTSLILCGFAKFILEFFRNSHIGQIMSLTQIISIAFVFIGIGIVFYKKQTKLKTT